MTLHQAPGPPGTNANRRPLSVSARLVLAVVVALATGLTGCGITADRTVDGWLIGPPRSCDDLSLAPERCDVLWRRALSHAEQVGGPVAGWSMHETRRSGVDGQPVLLDLGSGVPDGVLLVRHVDGSEQVALMGCLQPSGPDSPTDPSCP